MASAVVTDEFIACAYCPATTDRAVYLPAGWTIGGDGRAACAECSDGGGSGGGVNGAA